MSIQIKNLENRIEILRNMLVQQGLANGFGHPETIKLSQELDELIAKYWKKKGSECQPADTYLNSN